MTYVPIKPEPVHLIHAGGTIHLTGHLPPDGLHALLAGRRESWASEPQLVLDQARAAATQVAALRSLAGRLVTLLLPERAEAWAALVQSFGRPGPLQPAARDWCLVLADRRRSAAGWATGQRLRPCEKIHGSEASL